MKPKDRNLIVVGVTICIIIAVLAPFIASTNPDGLEKTTEQVPTNGESGIYQAPFADYKIPFLGDGPYSGVAALAIGVLIVLGLGYLGAFIIKKRRTQEISEKENLD
jgi:cobalt/nickel transport protein